METKLLKEVLSVPTKTYRETMMINFLVNYLHEKKYEYYLDGMNNVYITKQTDDVEYFPCVVAHTDTVHNIDTINIVEEQLPNEQGDIKLALKAYNDDNNPTGIGGDDKCGVFACLTLLDQLPNLKVALFVSEETGCHGSLNADDGFFENVGYVIEFDAPGNSMVTEYCWGVQLFDRDGDFFNVCNEVLTEGFNSRNDYQSHPYTDVMALKRKYNFSCINFAIGYYNYHTKHEYVVVEDVFNGIKTGKNMIEKLGNKLYPLKSILV